MKTKRERWGSRIGFILAAIGSAVGLGNIWRFPYMVYQGGGGAFIIPYFIAVFIIGIPMLMLEFGIGNYFQASAPSSFQKLKAEFIGWFAVSTGMFGVLLYYAVVIAWVLGYLIFPFTKWWGSNTQIFFQKIFLQLGEKPNSNFSLGHPSLWVLIPLFGVWFINWLIVIKGVKKGIEIANKIFIPSLVILIGILIINNLFLKNSFEGLKWYLKPDFGKLKQPKLWLDAFSQVFYSMSIGFGIMITYASYLSKEHDIGTDSVITAMSDSLFAFYAGFAVFSILGYLAFVLNKKIPEVVSAGATLAFITYPEALSKLPFAGRMFAIFFFLSLLFAGISSSISLLEAFVSALYEKFRIKRKLATTIVCIIGFSGGLIYTTQGGLYILDVVDRFVNRFGLITVGLIEVITISWFFETEKLITFISQKFALFKLGKWFKLLWKFLIPAILLTLLIIGIVEEIKAPYENYPRWFELFVGIGVLIVIFFIALILTISERKEK